MNDINEKQKEIELYKQILAKYNSGRWMNQGKEHLEKLELELAEMDKDAPPTDELNKFHNNKITKVDWWTTNTRLLSLTDVLSSVCGVKIATHPLDGGKPMKTHLVVGGVDDVVAFVKGHNPTRLFSAFIVNFLHDHINDSVKLYCLIRMI